MDEGKSKLSLDELYGAWNSVPDDFWEALDSSLNPRSPDMLYDKMEALGCGPGHHVLDIG